MARYTQITIDLSLPAERERVLAMLLTLRMLGNPLWKPIPIGDGKGRTLGYFFPVPLQPPKPPEMTPEERAELQRRLDTIDDAISAEEMIELLEKKWDEEDAARNR